MKFDKFFYAQRNRDVSGTITPLDDFDNCRMRGTKKCPIRTVGEIDALEIDFDIFRMSSEPLDEITLKLIVSQPYPSGLVMEGLSYYMQFLFYDFDKAIYLFLFNAKVIKINDIPQNDGQRFGLTITSARNIEAAYKMFEAEHKELGVE